jgi:hypothetical protein
MSDYNFFPNPLCLFIGALAAGAGIIGLCLLEGILMSSPSVPKNVVGVRVQGQGPDYFSKANTPEEMSQKKAQLLSALQAAAEQFYQSNGQNRVLDVVIEPTPKLPETPFRVTPPMPVVK